jgi:hypothetical protein
MKQNACIGNGPPVAGWGSWIRFELYVSRHQPKFARHSSSLGRNPEPSKSIFSLKKIIRFFQVRAERSRCCAFAMSVSGLAPLQAHNLKVIGSNPVPATKIDWVSSRTDERKMKLLFRRNSRH